MLQAVVHIEQKLYSWINKHEPSRHIPLSIFFFIPSSFLCFPNFSHFSLLRYPLSFLSLPPFMSQQEDVPPGRPAGMMPLVIPVSVPVRGGQTDPPGAWPQGRLGQYEQPPAQSEHKASVIVARRRSLRNSTSESSSQVGSARGTEIRLKMPWVCHSFSIILKGLDAVDVDFEANTCLAISIVYLETPVIPLFTHQPAEISSQCCLPC